MGQKWLFEYGTALMLFISRSESRKVGVERVGGDERHESSISECWESVSMACPERGAPIS